MSKAMDKMHNVIDRNEVYFIVKLTPGTCLQTIWGQCGLLEFFEHPYYDAPLSISRSLKCQGNVCGNQFNV